MVFVRTHKATNEALRRPLSRRLAPLGALAMALFSVACGAEDPNAGDNTSTGSLLPMATGNWWKYRVDDTGTITDKTTTIGPAGVVGGSGPMSTTRAYEITTQKGANLADKTVSYQSPLASDPQIIVRYRELSYGATSGMLTLEEHWDPYRRHIDGTAEHTKSGARYVDGYKEIKTPAGYPSMDPALKSDVWTVLDADVSITVNGKTYEHTIHLRKESGDTQNTKEYWYARGIGKIKEVGSQTEELLEYKVADTEGTLP